MDLGEVMRELEAMGTEANRRIYARHGAGEDQFGVSFADLNKLKKRIKTDQALAEALWDTENADARSLATMIADPLEFSTGDLDRWVGDVERARYYVLVDLIVRNVASRSPQALSKVDEWTRSGLEYVGQAGWELLAMLAMSDDLRPDSYYEGFLRIIEAEIHKRKNRVRHAMNSALIAIGMRNEPLREQALAVAASIGKVRVDHGETGCKTPDAARYIAKAWERKRVTRPRTGTRN